MDKPLNSFRYETSGHWYKGNTHIHSNLSDGGRDFTELAEMYHGAGFDFLFRTDHWITSDAEGDPQSYPLLWLDGMELDGQDHTGADYHVACLGKISGLRQEDGLEAGIQVARQQGAIINLAHPHWCGNSLEDALRWHFDGVEVYNNVCTWLNGKGNGLVHWDAALNANPNVLAFAVDDAHLLPGQNIWNGGWIVVNAQACTAKEIMAAIRSGNFYSSCGPEIHSITLDGTHLHLETSPVRFVRIVGPGWNGNGMGSPKGHLIREVDLPLPQDWRYVYVELEDSKGRRAWTNNLFIVE